MLMCKPSWGAVWDTAVWHRAEVLEAMPVILLSGPVPRNITHHWVICRDITPADEPG